MNRPTLSKDFVTCVYVLIFSACNFGETNLHLVFSPFTARPISLFATTKISVFFFITSLQPECDVYRLIARFAGLPEPF